MEDQPLLPLSKPPLQGRVQLNGQVDRITYMNEETGYAVARVLAEGYSSSITIVGTLLALTPGEVLEMEGQFEHHPKFGRQFRVISHRAVLPATAKGIKKYLGSGLIKGIGPVMAARIVRQFGDKTLEVIDERIHELERVEGLGKKRIKTIGEAWKEQKEIRAIMIFLQAHGVGLSHATKIFQRYGQRAVAVVSQNPFRLATDISGIGFPTADRIARALGFDMNSPIRAAAGILYVLDRMADEGHVFYPYEDLIQKCQDLLSVERDFVLEGFAAAALDNKVVAEDMNGEPDRFVANHKAVFLARLHRAEAGIARLLSGLMRSEAGMRTIDPAKATRWIQDHMKLQLARRQMDALKGAISNKVLMVTGGPGTGKTTLIHAIIRIFSAAGARISLAAPTGRAAKRMAEATGHTASTLHRLLEFSWHRGGFQRKENRPIEADLIIVDEASMVDTVLMYHLLKAVPSAARLILVGDSNQLPSVGPGNVLGDLIDSGGFPVVELNEVFRQARESLIIVNAHRINRGLFPELKGSESGLGDFYLIEQEDGDQALQVMRELVCNRIPARFGLQPMGDIQVLSPMHKGVMGTENLNQELQKALNPTQEGLDRGDRQFRVYDRVMQVRNNYEKEVFNGDIGLIRSISPEAREVVVEYDGRPVTYDYLELNEIVLAYAISVHKSQGSEYPAVVLAVFPQHYPLLQRNLIYTAVTRAKQLVVVVGSKRALAMGIRNDKILRRYTSLSQRLKTARRV
jgi:exodeoxyribonuclease V alpha subunit